MDTACDGLLAWVGDSASVWQRAVIEVNSESRHMIRNAMTAHEPVMD